MNPPVPQHCGHSPPREWVIPAKPKPGRKPKKETPSAPTVLKDEPDEESSGRRVQNRAAQRAFRERKQSQLAELQARLQSYEQGEIERNPGFDGDGQETRHSTLSFGSFPSSSSSLVSSPIDPGGFSPGLHEDHSRHSNFPTPPPPITNTLTVDTQDSIDSFACILCTPDEPCVCRELAAQQAANETLSCSDSLQQLALQVRLRSTSLPAFQPPVPIRRRTGPPRVNSIFPVTSFASSSASSSNPTPKCSGDPDNCMACADDNFGKAFCQAIDHTVNSPAPCVDCPRRTSQTDKILVGGCCGDISKCGSCGIAPIISSTNAASGPETIPTDDAWRQLKSHPNVAFGDLALLAEVVARRSKCVGSRVVISPAPGSITPEREAGPSHHASSTVVGEDQSVLLTDPHEHFHQKQRQQESPPRLVPQHVLIECGRRKMKEVNADGVREALRLLDQKFAHTR
ncbi:hypothetical protein BU15DRAFT_87452 [Melanogaster broomeanus]|nr:hypothetical protein BU15DRAFT_87452 [Melanogaster broomeanus]